MIKIPITKFNKVHLLYNGKTFVYDATNSLSDIYVRFGKCLPENIAEAPNKFDVGYIVVPETGILADGAKIYFTDEHYIERCKCFQYDILVEYINKETKDIVASYREIYVEDEDFFRIPSFPKYDRIIEKHTILSKLPVRPKFLESGIINPQLSIIDENNVRIERRNGAYIIHTPC